MTPGLSEVQVTSELNKNNSDRVLQGSDRAGLRENERRGIRDNGFKSFQEFLPLRDTEKEWQLEVGMRLIHTYFFI